MKRKFNKYQRKEIAKFLKLVHGKERVNLFDVFSALIFLIHSSCKWKQLPSYYPHYWVVYYYFRHWSDTGLLDKFLQRVVLNRRKAKERHKLPTVAIIDSQSVKSGYSQSLKGVDGFKRIKGIKRQLAVDSDGLPLCIDVTKANVHDTKGVTNLLDDIKILYPSVSIVKADKGYIGVKHNHDFDLQCVKSNYGTSDFIPLHGRWVVERTFAWLSSFRRLNCNYERYLSVAKSMATLACIAFVLRL